METPECPRGWFSLWKGYSFVMVRSSCYLQTMAIKTWWYLEGQQLFLAFIIRSSSAANWHSSVITDHVTLKCGVITPENSIFIFKSNKYSLAKHVNGCSDLFLSKRVLAQKVPGSRWSLLDLVWKNSGWFHTLSARAVASVTSFLIPTASGLHHLILAKCSGTRILNIKQLN